MTSPFTPAEIETLRKIINGELDREADYAAIIAANKTLDRLSPPEPEQPDEATKVWREMLVNAFEAVNDAPMVEAHRKGALPLSAWDEAQISRLRKVLAEKDAERDKWENSANYAHRQLGNATAELATLRAENERLKKLDVEYGQIETAIIFADPEFDGDSDHATCGERLIASVKRLAKAAERNPAEPDILSVRAERALGQIPAPDKAPVVEVTQADHDAAYSLAPYLTGTRGFEPARLAFTRYRTEAEARGRREALETIRERVAIFFRSHEGTARGDAFSSVLSVIDNSLKVMP